MRGPPGAGAIGGGGVKRPFERMSRELRNQTGGRLAAKEQRDLARFVGLKEVKGQHMHGQPVFTNGKRFYTYDVDGHNGALFKRAGSVRDLGSKQARDGSYGLGRYGPDAPWEWYRGGD
jgi:hypothetical protein